MKSILTFFRLWIGLLTLLIGIPCTGRADETQGFAEPTAHFALPSYVTVFRLPAGASNDSPHDPLSDWIEGNPRALLPAEIGGGVVCVLDDQRNMKILTVSSLLGDMSSEQARNSSMMIHTGLGRCLPARVIARDPVSQLAVLEATLPPQWVGFNLFSEAPGTKAPTHTQAASKQIVSLYSDPIALARSGAPAIVPTDIRRKGWIRQFSPTSNQQYDAPPLGTMPRFWIDRLPEPGITGGLVSPPSGGNAGLVAFPSAASHTGSGLAVIPISGPMQRVVDALVSGIDPEYGFLGLKLKSVSPDEFPEDQLDQFRGFDGGLRVISIPQNFPSPDQELNTGDIILAVERVSHPEHVEASPMQLNRMRLQPLRPDEFNGWIQLQEPGAHVALTIWSQSSSQIEVVVLPVAKFPVPPNSEQVFTASRQPLWRGLRVGFLPPQVIQTDKEINWRFESGVLVTDVLPGSAAAKAGIQTGDVIVKIGERIIDTPASFLAATEDWPNDAPITLSNKVGEIFISRE